MGTELADLVLGGDQEVHNMLDGEGHPRFILGEPADDPQAALLECEYFAWERR